MPEPRRMLELGQCATPVPVSAIRPDLVRVEVDRVRIPDVRPQPIQPPHIRHRAAAELLQAEALLVLRLGHVGVQRQPVLARPGRRAPHRLAGHRERRAGRHDDAQHRIGRRVVERARQPLAVGEDLLFVSTTLSGGRPPCDGPATCCPGRGGSACPARARRESRRRGRRRWGPGRGDR